MKELPYPSDTTSPLTSGQVHVGVVVGIGTDDELLLVIMLDLEDGILLLEEELVAMVRLDELLEVGIILLEELLDVGIMLLDIEVLELGMPLDVEMDIAVLDIMVDVELVLLQMPYMGSQFAGAQ